MPYPFAPSPPTIRDVDKMPEMQAFVRHPNDLMGDACPGCGAFRMDVSYYKCMGVCDVCANEEADEWERLAENGQ